MPTMKADKAIAILLAAPGLASPDDGPVTRVVSLLEELKSRIEVDGESEQKVYDKYACWCETTTARKAASIVEAREELKQLGTTILKLKGTIATRSTEIKELLQDIKENEEAQAKATKIRARENAEFVAEKSETQQALAALEKAMTVLSANTLLEKSSELQKVSVAIQNAADRAKLSSRQLSAFNLLVHGQTGAAYAPQSATIQGILSDMYETFAGSLESAEHNEATLHRNYEKLMHVKQKELITLQESVAKKQQEKAESETILADATQNYADTEVQMHADVDFFDATKESCQGKTEEWSKRKELRASELEGITEALKILSSDEAKELFSKSIKAGIGTGTSGGAFLQTESHTNAPISQAFKTLELHARASHSTRLAALAATLRLDGKSMMHKSGHFDEVIKAIDTLMGTLEDEQKADDKKVTDCKEKFQDLTLKIEDLEWKIENNEAAIQKLEEIVAAKETEKSETVKELEKLGDDIKTMESTRKSENDAFVTAKDDDERAIDLLQQAKEKLQEYYKSKGGFVQEDPSALDDPDVAPEAKFSDKNSRKNESKGIVALLTIIIEDLQEEIKTSKAGEESAQLDFEKRLAAAKKLEADLTTKETNLGEQISVKNDEIEKEKGVLGENKESKTNEEKTKADIKPECDWMIKNLDERRKKRKTEMEGLIMAKQYLAGAKPPMGLTELKRHNFDDSAFGRISFGAVSFLQRRT